MFILFIIFMQELWYRHKEVISDPLLWITVTFFILLFLRTVFAVFERPDLKIEHLDEARRWFRSGFLPVLVVAYAVARLPNPKWHAAWLLIAYALGILLPIIFKYDWSQLEGAVFEGHRTDFGIARVIQSALWVGCGAVATAVGGGIIAYRVRSDYLKWLCLTVAMLIMGLFLIALILTKTRTVWIGFVLGIAIAGLLLLYHVGWRNRQILIGGASGLVVILLVTVPFSDDIRDRWTNISGAIGEISRAVVMGNVSDLPSNSISIRLHYNVLGLELLAKRPMFGYGPAEPRYLRDEHPAPPKNVVGRDDHFHNGYLDFALRFGIVGLLMLIGLFACALYSASLWFSRDPPEGRWIGVALVAVLIMIFVHQLANQRFNDFTFVYVFSLFAGISWAITVIERRQTSRLGVP